jgi:hypothetical protein
MNNGGHCEDNSAHYPPPHIKALYIVFKFLNTPGLAIANKVFHVGFEPRKRINNM